ncbi:GNAT family N-acetyltransferase [Grimontia sp. NTOU-MAR1]|uniref:GNAT family N-acetyltransferase n=1 Tax=Grimontia sp. NTOU-MAR1 TaxID=3111011 RepID=UPI002DBAF0CA|nr:GNAT family N-acetyltransferase [Grimontia sp. NTOU-MAR1]WRV99649.1 GNAT family N-acetyltransferase [Grimontia sp. NTOU-MAR1]
MLLVPFRDENAPQLCEWIKSGRDNFLWGGPAFDFPLQIARVREHIAKKEVTPYLVMHEGVPIGYIDIYRVSKSEVRLCRVLIAETSARGKGLGKQLVSLALDVVTEDPRIRTVSLAVFAHNEIAVRCYTSLGFEMLCGETKVREFQEEDWTLYRMTKRIA